MIGGRAWVWMGRTPRLGSHSVMSSLVVFRKGWRKEGGMGLDGEDTWVRVSLCRVCPSCVYKELVGGRGWV